MNPPGQSVEQPGSTNKRWLLRQISLFAKLSDAQIDFISSRSRLVEYEKGETLYSQGDPPDALYCLMSGRIRAFSRNASGKQEQLDVIPRGEYFGMISLLTSEPHSVTTQAINDSLILKIRQIDFDAILKEIPEIAIHLSTALSRRISQKNLGQKRVFESTLISIYSHQKGSGRTTYAINLAASLHKETGKRVVLLDISPSGDSVCQALGVTQCPVPIRLKGAGFDQGRISASIIQHSTLGIDTLNVSHDPRVATDVTQVTPLLSYMANLYHFVITDLPNEIDRTVFKAMVQADMIHIVSEGTREHLEETDGLIAELKKTIQQADDRIKLIVNEPSEEFPLDERGKIVEHKIYATLPRVETPPAPGHPIVLAHPDWAYAKTIRRISREIGGVLIGLVLGSGAAMGLAHIGVLRVLEREKIPIDVIAGSSIGALIGGFLAAGWSTEKMKTLAAEFRSKTSLFRLIDLTIPKLGIFTGRRITKLLAHHLGTTTFRDLKIPLRVTACDYAQRTLVVFEEGSVVEAIRASVSIPAIFEPIQVNQRWLIDGGVLDPVPVDVLTRMGVRKIIAVNTLPSPEDIHRRQKEVDQERIKLSEQARQRGKLHLLWFRAKEALWKWLDPNIFDVIMHTMQGMEYILAEAQCAQADVVLHPTIPRTNWFEFYNVDQLIRRGEEETEAHLPQIKKMAFEQPE